MVSYILALFSLLFILPLVYFLPIGFTKRGKLLLVGLSLVISMIGVYSQSLFTWWQTVLILLVLLIACTYILLNRMPDFLFTNSQEETESILGWDGSEAYTTSAPEPSFRTNIVETEDLTIEAEENNMPPLVEIEQEVYQSAIDSSLPVVEKELDEIELVIEEIGINEEVDGHDASNILEENNDREDEYDLNYMEELEKIITSEVSPDLNQYAVATEEAIVEIGNNELLAELEDIDFRFLENEEETVSYDEMENNPVLETSSEILLKALDELEDVIIADKIEEKTEKVLQVDAEELVSQTGNEVTHKIINNTFQQLQLMKKLVDPIEYENIVSHCLKEDMPLQEYYLIASLLMEHFMQQKEKTKLQSLFSLLKDKFKQESILLEQIIFLEKHYK